jgi:hypothetical protein
MKKLIDSTPSLRDMREDYLLKNAARLWGIDNIISWKSVLDISSLTYVRSKTFIKFLLRTL